MLYTGSGDIDSKQQGSLTGHRVSGQSSHKHLVDAAVQCDPDTDSHVTSDPDSECHVMGKPPITVERQSIVKHRQVDMVRFCFECINYCLES